MQRSGIKEYLSEIGIRKVMELDTALIEVYGQKEGERHIKRLMELFEQSEKQMLYGAGDTVYLHRQEKMVDYLNQSLQMSFLATSFYDRVFFGRVMEYLVRFESFFAGDILDMGCGNGVLTCFLAMRYPDSFVTGLDFSANAIYVAKELAEKLQIENVDFADPGVWGRRKCGTLFSCRTAHENVAWIPLLEESKASLHTADEQEKRHRQYAEELSALVKPKGYLISVERYRADDAYAGLIRALGSVGFDQVKGTHMEFSCKNGDEPAVFQAAIFQKKEMI